MYTQLNLSEEHVLINFYAVLFELKTIVKIWQTPLLQSYTHIINIYSRMAICVLTRLLRVMGVAVMAPVAVHEVEVDLRILNSIYLKY